MARQSATEQRRQEVIDAATALVISHGRAALTVRAVAAAVGCSTKVVSHHFADMAELLHATYASAAARSRRRIARVLEADPLDLAGAVEAVLPLDAGRRGDWAVWFAFWTEALTDPALRADQRRRARATTKRFQDIIEALAAAGVPLRLPADEAARRLLVLVQGLAAQAMFDPAGWPAARQRAVVARELELAGLTAAPSRPGTRRRRARAAAP